MVYEESAIHERLVNIVSDLVPSLDILLPIRQPFFFLTTLLIEFFIPSRGGNELSDQGPKICF